MEALLSQLPENNTPAVIVVKPERPRPVSRNSNTRADPNQPKYDPSMIFALELATVLTLRDNNTLEALGESLATTLQSLVRDAKNLHPLTVSRVVSYLLNLLRLSHVSFIALQSGVHFKLTAARINTSCESPLFFMLFPGMTRTS